MPTTILDGETLEQARARRFAEEAAAIKRTMECHSTACDTRKFVDELRTRINPAYANQLGTESYERRLCAEAIESTLQRVDELLAALERLSIAAACRENTVGDPIRLIETRAELRSAIAEALIAITKEKT